MSTTLITYDNGNDHVGDKDKSPRYMHSHGVLTDDGLLTVTTRTWTDILMAGFHGGVKAQLADANGICVAQTPVHVFGVDGKWIGQHDRTDTWTYNVDPATAAKAKSMTFTNSWNYEWLQSVQNTMKWIGVAIAVLAQAVDQSGNGQIS